MANSLSFNGYDLSTYGLIVTRYDLPVVQDATAIRVQDKAHAWRSSLKPKAINLGVAINASSLANLNSYLDSIKAILNTRENGQLILDSLSDRYWLARFEAFRGGLIAPTAWRGDLIFAAPDSLAFSTTETSSNHSINADPKTVTETPGGTAEIEPLYTLTAGEAFEDATIILKNLTRNEELQWTGDLSNGATLEIDVANYLVSISGSIDDMLTVSGQFPRLSPGANNIKVTGFGSLGSLNIKYRARYL